MGVTCSSTIANKPTQTNHLASRWRMVSMSAWDRQFIDEEAGYFELGQKNNGQFHFGYVHG